MGKAFVRNTLAVGGGLILGFAVGIIFMKDNPLYFAGSILIGLGLGIITAGLISNGEK